MKKVLGLAKGEGLLYLCMILGGYLFGIVLEGILLATIGTESEMAGLGSIMACIMTGITMFCMMSIGMGQEFNLALRFQRTRGQFFVRYLVEKSCYIAAGVGFILILGYLELEGLKRMFPEVVLWENANFFMRIPVWCYPFGIVFFLGAASLLGGIVLKLGTKGAVVWLIVWLAVCLGPRSLSQHEELFLPGTLLGGVIGFWGSLGLWAKMAAAGAAGALCLTAAWGLIRRQRVTD